VFNQFQKLIQSVVAAGFAVVVLRKHNNNNNNNNNNNSRNGLRRDKRRHESDLGMPSEPSPKMSFDDDAGFACELGVMTAVFAFGGGASRPEKSLPQRNRCYRGARSDAHQNRLRCSPVIFLDHRWRCASRARLCAIERDLDWALERVVYLGLGAGTCLRRGRLSLVAQVLLVILQSDVEIERLVALREAQSDERMLALILDTQHKVSTAIGDRFDRSVVDRTKCEQLA
jgi:hypothetical protein